MSSPTPPFQLPPSQPSSQSRLCFSRGSLFSLLCFIRTGVGYLKLLRRLGLTPEKQVAHTNTTRTTPHNTEHDKNNTTNDHTKHHPPHLTTIEVIRILVAAPQDYVNTCTTRRVNPLSGKPKTTYNFTNCVFFLFLSAAAFTAFVAVSPLIFARCLFFSRVDPYPHLLCTRLP